MVSSSFCARIVMCKTKRTFLYDRTPVLGICIVYPKAFVRQDSGALKSINCRIQAQVNDFYHYASVDLYHQAIAGYEQARQNGFPFHRYDAILEYEITYNQHCHLSLYRDQYEYTGGAHGGTVRASDTFDLRSGERLPLSGFFPGREYRALLIQKITEQADERMRQEPGIFFENYRSLIVEYFNEEQYYLTPDGLAVYYQQYEIAPYATGIVVFTIPYPALNLSVSCCRS